MLGSGAITAVPPPRNPEVSMATAHQQHHIWSVGRHEDLEERESHWLLTFGTVMLALVASFNILYGIAAIARSHIFINNVLYVFGDLRTWGWVTLFLGVAQVFAVVGITERVQAARWAGVAFLGLNAFAQMASIPAYPIWSILIIALDVMAIFGLAAQWPLPFKPAPPATMGPTPHS
jgi:hypothetical protein